MSMGNDDHLLLETSDNDKKETKEKPSFSYTIEFLLSLSDLDACKRLPRGFDPSILSEFEDASNNLRDRQKVSVDSFLHRSRRGEYSASPPTKSEGLSGFSRGSHVRWDNRSSGSNDRDGDFQSERESFAQGKRTGNNSWRSSSNPEQDGLLGSGNSASSRPSLYAGGNSKVQTSGSYQLSKSSEPYQPPRPYKAVPYTRRDVSDSLNDETFGSSEISSDDKVEEEKRRRASFELMRKEHQKALQEKQASVIIRSKDSFGTDITTLIEKTEEVMDSLSSKSNREENQMMQSIMQGEPEKYPPSHANVSRPLVPPGFASTILEKNHNAKTSTTFSTSEVVNNRFEENDRKCKDKSVIHNHTYNKQYEEKLDMLHPNEQQKVVQNIDIPSVSMYGESKCLSQNVEGSLLFDTSLTNISSPPQASNNHAKDVDQIIDDEEVEEISLPRIVAKDSSSILDKLFGTVPTVNVDASTVNIDTPHLSVEYHGTNEDNSWSSIPSHSSKFAPWFLEEEEKEMNRLQSTKPKDMFSLFASDDNNSPMLTNSPQIIASKDDEFTEKVTAFPIAFSKEKPLEEISHTTKPNASLGMLTCEDLEQSILAEMNEMNCGPQVLPGSWSNFDKHNEEQKASVDNRASQHLLSLLQKVPSLKEAASVPSSNSSSINNHIVSSTSDVENPGDAASIHTSVKTLTLETLFGTTFMKELHSTSAPVSVQKNPLSGSTQTNLLNSNDSIDSSFCSTNIDHLLSSNLKSSVESSHLSMNPCKIQKHWLGLNNGVSSEESIVEIQLPEEENLITMGDSAISRTSFVSSGNDTRTGILFPSESDTEITDKLAALNSVPKGERRLPSLAAQFNPHHPYGSLEPDILNSHLLVPPSSLQMPTNFLRSTVSPLELGHHRHHHHHQNPQMRLIKPDNIHHDVHNHPFPTSAIQNPFYGPTEPRFDPINKVSLHQMNMLWNFPSPQSYEGMPREFLHPINDVGSYTHDLSRMHGVLLNPRPSNYAGIEAGMPVSGISGGSGMNHPDALKKLMGIYNPAANVGMRYK